MRNTLTIIVCLFLISCKSKEKEKQIDYPDQFIVVLGVAQDAGYPQIGCEKECCKAYYEGNESRKHITSFALVNRKDRKYWLFEATPDIGYQLSAVQQYLGSDTFLLPEGIFITHAHIGHYSGLMQLGREALGAKDIPVWAMPRMDSFLCNNGPWSQLVSLNNIGLQKLQADSAILVNGRYKVTPIKVPHRDEYSETVGFVIQSSRKKILFIPDIDKWEKWDLDIASEIRHSDIALLDGTFYRNGELPGRDMSEIPHPFVEETLKRLDSLPASEKKKVVFIHFNHTNPLLKKQSPEKDKVKAAGYGVAEEGMIIEL